jgi:hypothetical protein
MWSSLMESLYSSPLESTEEASARIAQLQAELGHLSGIDGRRQDAGMNRVTRSVDSC